jgi:hypothetical protein
VKGCLLVVKNWKPENGQGAPSEVYDRRRADSVEWERWQLLLGLEDVVPFFE